MAIKVEGAPDGIAFFVVPVTDATPVQILPARASRRQLFLTAPPGLGLNNVYLGADSSVTHTTGFQAASLPSPLETAAGLWAICVPGTSSSVLIVELFDVEG